MASQSQVGGLVGPAVLLGHNMFHVVGKLTVLLAKQAILATIVGPPAD
jgi:hypothetical protein